MPPQGPSTTFSVETFNQTYGAFDHRSPIYQRPLKVKEQETPKPSNLTSPVKALVPDEERVIHEYKLIEKGFEGKQPPNSILLAKVKTVIPKIPREQSKADFDICKLGPGEVPYKDIERIEALAKRKS